MKIFLHDRSGHPFTVQLSRELARRGHHVAHSYASFFQSPKGVLSRVRSDPPTLEFVSVDLEVRFDKYSLLRRWFQEKRYVSRLSRAVARFQPEVVVLANTPPEAFDKVFRMPGLKRIKKIAWVQDVYGLAVGRILSKRLGVLGILVGAYYSTLERRALKRSDHIILITEEFKDVLVGARGTNPAFEVIPNWAPLEDLPVFPKSNEWAKEQRLSDKFCFLYSGTLGKKHDPNLLVEVAECFRFRNDVRVVVVSEGIGAKYLAEQRQKKRLENLLILDFQPFERMPEILATGDVLLALLEEDAGVFSVPSKVLSYLCARRPILASIPLNNMAARILIQADAGLVSAPRDVATFLECAKRLYSDPQLRDRFGRNGRAYAERTFDIQKIADRFEKLILS